MFNRYWGRDRRRFQRLKVNFSVWYKVVSPAYLKDMMGEREIEANTIDLSHKGHGLSNSCLEYLNLEIHTFQDR